MHDCGGIERGDRRRCGVYELGRTERHTGRDLVFDTPSMFAGAGHQGHSLTAGNGQWVPKESLPGQWIPGASVTQSVTPPTVKCRAVV